MPSSHPWAALIMCTTGLLCLKTLGLTIPIVMKAGAEESDIKSEDALLLEEEEEEAPVL